MDNTTTIIEQLRAAMAAKLPTKKDLSFVEFAKKNLQIRTVDNRVMNFDLRPIQLKYLERKRAALDAGKPPRFLLLKYRRGGFTTVEQALSYHLVSRNRNISVLTLAQDGDTTARIFRIPVLMHQRDPEAPEIKGVGNQYKLEFPVLNSLFYVGTAAGRGVGRGDTLSRVHWSEVAWSCLGYNQTTKQRDILTGLSEAASHGEMVLETTPNGSEMFREMYAEAKMGKNDWTAIFLPWFVDHTNKDLLADPDEEKHHIFNTLDEDEVRLVDAHGLTAEQLKWRRRKKRELKRLFYQEYPEDDETCWLISGTPFFDPQLLMKLRDYCESPELKEDHIAGQMPSNGRTIPGGYEVAWEEPDSNVEYCMGVDTSEGLPGCDPCGIAIMRRDNGKQVFATHGLFNARILAEQVVKYSKKYNDALVGIERENHGHAVIQKVIDLGLSKPHYQGGSLYYHGGMTNKVQQEGRVARAGWTTNVITRPVILEGLRDWMDSEDALERVMDRQFLTECMTFRLQADGGFSADPGCHDDTISKWAIANQMRVTDWRRKGVTIVRASRWRR